MRSQFRASVLAFAIVGLLLASGLPLGAASDPVPAQWSPTKVPATVTALSLSKEGTTLAAGNAFVQPPGGSNVPAVDASRPADFRAFDLESGRLFNASETPGGKTAVAASRDGRIVAAGGSIVTDNAVTYYRVPAERQSGEYGPQWTIIQPGVIAGLALSANGKRLAVLVNEQVDEDTVRGLLRVYDDSKTLLLEHTNPGRLNSVAMSADGRYVITGGTYERAGDERTYGIVNLHRYPTPAPVDREIVSTENGSEVTSVRITPDGNTFAAVTKGGEVLVFQNRERDTPSPARYGTPDANVTARALALSEDGRIVVAGMGDRLVTLAHDAGAMSVAWNRTVRGTVTSVDTNATGAIIVAGVTGGGDGGVHAFSPESEAAFWSLANTGATNVTMTADGRWVAYAVADRVHAARLPSRVSLLFETSEGRGVQNAPFATTEPRKPLAFPMLVRNDGAYPETVRLQFPDVQHVDFRANRTEFTLNPDEVARVEVTVTPQRLDPGTYQYNVTAVSDSDFTTNATLQLRITGKSQVRVDMQRASERTVIPGQNESIVLSLANDGNSRANVSVAVAQEPSAGDQWPVYLVGERQFSIRPGTISTVRVLVDVPELAVNGSRNRVTVTVDTPNGPVQTSVLFKVNPSIGVNLSVPGRTMFVYAPGESVQFNVTVTNTGSTAAEFAASHVTEATAGRTWVTGLDVSPFSLAPGENHTLAVRVFAPKNGEFGDSSAIVVEVRSLPTEPGIPEAYENVTLYANLIQPPPSPPPQREDQVFVPATGTLAAAGALAAALFIAHRRRFS